MPVWYIKNITTFIFPIFFIGSGLFIGQILVSEYYETSRINIPRFWIRRILRTWPIYFLGLVLAIQLSPELPAQGLMPFILFFQNFTQNRYADGFYIHSWTLAIEEQFYLVSPLLLLPLLRRDFYRRGLILLFVLSLLSRWYWDIKFSMKTNHSLLWSDALLFGLYFAHPESGKIISFINRWAKSIQVLSIMIYTIIRLNANFFGHFYLPLTFLCSLFFIFSVYTGESFLGRFLSGSVFQYLAKRSYAYYIFHFIPILLIAKYPELGILLKFIFIFVGTLLLGEISWQLIESPLLKYRDRLFR